MNNINNLTIEHFPVCCALLAKDNTSNVADMGVCSNKSKVLVKGNLRGSLFNKGTGDTVIGLCRTHAKIAARKDINVYIANTDLNNKENIMYCPIHNTVLGEAADDIPIKCPKCQKMDTCTSCGSDVQPHGLSGPTILCTGCYNKPIVKPKGTIKCDSCKGYHSNFNEVRKCFGLPVNNKFVPTGRYLSDGEKAPLLGSGDHLINTYNVKKINSPYAKR